MDFVIVGNAWSAALENPTGKHQIALELVRQGHRVLWIEGAGMRTPRLASGRDRSRVLGKVRAALRGVRPAGCGAAGGCLWVGTPLFLPLPSYAAVRRFNGWVCRAASLAWAAQAGLDRPVLLNYVPVLGGAMRRWPGARIYYCVDRWDAFAMYDSRAMRRAHEQCCGAADLAIATAEDLRADCARLAARTALVSHGVDHAHFASALRPCRRPADLPDGQVVGFFGLLSEWIDQALLVRLAGELPEARVALIGAADVPVDALRAAPGIRLLGPKPFRELPSYLAHFNVGIIPFAVNALTRAVNPVKLREMLAAGCPVVSTGLPEVSACVARAGFAPGLARFAAAAADGDRFVSAVRAVLEAPANDGERRALSDSMRDETWERKVRRILELATEISGR